MLCVTDKPLELIDSMNVSVAKNNVKHDLSLIVIEGRCISAAAHPAVATAGDYTIAVAAHPTAARSVHDQDVGEMAIDTFPVFPSESKNSADHKRETPPPAPNPPSPPPSPPPAVAAVDIHVNLYVRTDDGGGGGAPPPPRRRLRHRRNHHRRRL